MQERAEEAAAASDRRAEQAEARALEAEARRDKALATAEEASAAAAVAIQDGKHHQERWSAEAAQCRSDAGAAAQVGPALLCHPERPCPAVQVRKISTECAMLPGMHAAANAPHVVSTVMVQAARERAD